MKRTILLTLATLSLAACVDTTGLSAESSKYPHPDTGENAVVTVAEYGDLQCPACQAAHVQLVKPLIAQYGERIRYEYHQFPLVSIHRYAMEAAEATECAADQGKFWELVDTIYMDQTNLDSEQLTEWGQQLGLDMDLYTRCRESHIKRDAVKADYDAGKALGVAGTPTFFINGQKVESTGAAMSAAIDAALGTAANRL